MRMRLQYADGTIWEDLPERMDESPDPRPPQGGVIRMVGVTDDGRLMEFAYDDFYYAYRDDDGSWILGSGTPKREFRFLSDGTAGIRIPVRVPVGAVVRYGVTVTNEEAVKFGLRFDFKPRKTHELVSAVSAEDGGIPW